MSLRLEWLLLLMLGAFCGAVLGMLFGAGIGALLGILAVVLLWLFLHRKATKLNLTIEGTAMLNIGQTATAHIAPTAAGVPAPVTSVVYDVTPAGAYTIVQAADGLSAVYTAVVPGTGIMATVSAINAAGSSLTDTAALPDIAVAVPVADALNLTITTP